MKKAKGNASITKKSRLVIILIAVVVSIVPLITYLKAEEITDIFLELNWMKGVVGDYFSYYKSIWITIFTIMALSVFFVHLYMREFKIQKSRYYTFMVAYLIFVILSTLISSYKGVAINGFLGRHEGAYVLLIYVILMFITMNIPLDLKTLDIIYWGLLASSTVICIIAIMQYFGLNILNNPIVQRLIMPSKYYNPKNIISIEQGVNATLPHYNYMGSYLAMLFPFSLIMLFSKNMNAYKRVFTGINCLVTIVTALICNSRAGIVGIIFSAMILIILMWKFIIRGWKVLLPCILSIFVILLLFNSFSSGKIIARLGSIINDVKVALTGESNTLLKSVQADDKVITMNFTDSSLTIENNNGNILFKDVNGAVLTTGYENGKILFNDKLYKDYEIELGKVNDNSVLVIQKSGYAAYFLLSNDGFKFMASNGDPIDIVPVSSWGFEGKETLGSARGYIWSRTLPLLKNTIFVGYGPDTFAYVFPQHDKIGKLIAYQSMNTFVDKPHNMYLNVALSTGFISLIALLIMFGIYFVSCFKLYFKNQIKNNYYVYGIASFVAFNGYLASCMFNDSVVAVAPIFWVLFGIGININRIIKEYNCFNTSETVNTKLSENESQSKKRSNVKNRRG